MDVHVGDIITMKKKHPCGGASWEVLRIGADFKIRCTRCGHELMNSRSKVEKYIKEIQRGELKIKI